MLTRVRFEAEGPTPDDCRRDMFAAAERLLSAALARIYCEPESDADFSLRISSWVNEEVYSALAPDERMRESWQLYRGRLVIGLPIGPPEQTFTDSAFRYAHVATEDLIAPVAECEHPPEAVYWNVHNDAYQCHRCGARMDIHPSQG